MPTRTKFPSEYFDSNPFEGESLDDIYRRLQWGNEPNEVLEIDAPEPLVALGEAAQLVLAHCRLQWDEGEAHLAIGAESNKIYIFPRGAAKIPDEGFEPLGESEQIDYYSDKGAEAGYYYHEHEAPFPQVTAAPGGFFVIEPQVSEDGERSYAVSDEGIIG
jgi:hypothetical protein